MKYHYSGPTSGVTLQQGESVQEIMLHTGAEIELMEDHEYTQTLLALGYLSLAAVLKTPVPVDNVVKEKIKGA